MISACLFSKEESEYDKCFSEISKAIKRHPRLIVSDFEKAILNSLTKHFPNSKIAGCFFHLTQNLWKKMGEYNLQSKYDKEKENRVYKSFSYLKCLAFLPPNDVIQAFQFIKSSSPVQFAGILKYFETYYIGKRVKQNAELRKVPMFPINIWSVYERVLNDDPRCNNSLEAWHNAFALKVGDAHPTIYKFIQHLREEQDSAIKWIAQVHSGIKVADNIKERKRNERIKFVVQNYSNNSLRDFFECLLPAIKN